jgi:Ca2+-binding EF-hand superfamily protein
MGLLLEEYDVDQSGNLDMQKLTRLITDHEIRNGKDNPAVPSEAEISWILQTAGKNKENTIDATELETALKLWGLYVKNRAKFEKMFSIKIDAKQRLDFNQLKLFLSKQTAYPLKASEIFALRSHLHPH